MKQQALHAYHDSPKAVRSFFPLLHECKYEEAEKLLLDLLTVILKRNEVIVEDNPQYRKDRGALLILDIFFDVEYDRWMKETHNKETTYSDEGANEVLLHCAKNKKEIENLIHEIFEYLSLRTHFYPYQNLVQALEAYIKGKRTSALDEKSRIHYAYDSNCSHCLSFIKKVGLVPYNLYS